MPETADAFDLLESFYLTRGALERCSGLFFQAFGLTDAQFNILFILAQRDGPAPQSELVDELLVGKASVSIVLARMQRDGLIVSAKSAKDRRHAQVSLTRRGRNLWTKIAPLYRAQVEQVFGAIPPPARAAFLRALTQLHQSACAAASTPQTHARL